MLGPHINQLSGELLARLAIWRPAVAVALHLSPTDTIGQRIKILSPETTVIGRLYRDDAWYAENIMREPVSTAYELADWVKTAAQRNPGVAYWQTNNEVLQQTPDQMAKLSIYTMRLCNLVYPIRIAGGCMGTGATPHFGDDGGATWMNAVAMLETLIETHGVLLLHEYWGSPSHFVSERTGHWNVGRYQYRVRPFLPAHVRDVPTVYGETGCDFGVIARGVREGWITHYQRNVNLYAAHLLERANAMASWAGCLGGAIYQAGETGGTWHDFAIDGQLLQSLSTTVWPVRETPKTTFSLAATLRQYVPVGVEVEDLHGVLPIHVSKHYEQRSHDAITTVVLHHTAGSRAISWERIARLHVEDNDWPGIGYHVGIRLYDGVVTVSILNDLETISWHVENSNAPLIGVCLAGNFETTEPTELEVDTVRAVIVGLEAWLGRPLSFVGHRDVRDTACPGTNLYDAVFGGLEPVDPGPEDSTMQLSKWFAAMGVKVIKKEDRPDAAKLQAEKPEWQYDLVAAFVTLDGAWEVDPDKPNSIEQWARDAYLKPQGHPLWCAGGGGDHNANMQVLTADGNPVEGKGLLWWTDFGLGMLADYDLWPGRIISRDTDKYGWENVPMDGWGWNSNTTEMGPGWMCPLGYSDVIGGIGMRDNWHNSFFAIYRQVPFALPEQFPVDYAPTDAEAREAAWNAVGKAYNGEAAFQKFATAHDLGVPMTDELDLGADAGQGFAGGILRCERGKWDQIRKLSW